MAVTDLVADAFTMIRNAAMVNKEHVDIPGSNLIKNILDIFKRENYIDNFKVMEDKKQGRIRVYLKLDSRQQSVITNIKRVSRPGLRVYVKRDSIPRVLRGYGTAIISTSKGILTDKECRQDKLGGEVICYVW